MATEGASSGGASPGGSTSGGAPAAGAPAGGATNAGQGGSGGASGSLSGNAGSGGSVAGGSSAGSAGSGTGGAAGGMAATAVFSDDFEAAAIGAKWVRRINGGGTFALDTAHKHSGAQSLHTSPNNGYSTLLAIEGAPVFPAPNNTFYGRVWFWLPAATFQVVKPASGGPHVIWLEAGLAMNDTQELRDRHESRLFPDKPVAGRHRSARSERRAQV